MPRDAAALALVLPAPAGGQLPELLTETCPACPARPTPGCAACLGRGEVAVIAELLAADNEGGAPARWRTARRVDAAAGRAALGARLLPDGRVAYGVAVGVRLVDLEPFAGRAAAEHREVLAAWAGRRAAIRAAIAATCRHLAAVPPSPPSPTFPPSSTRLPVIAPVEAVS